jgi:hypothetical protein
MSELATDMRFAMQGNEVFLCLKRLKYIRTVTLQSQDVTQGLQKIT